MVEVTAKRRKDTRERIQEIALERFTTHGYDQTSLREIAEDLGVTKAALYYHFKSKEEILDSMLANVSRDVDDLIAWMDGGPATRERRIEMLTRLAAIIRGTHGGIMRCVQQNEAAFQRLGPTTSLVHELKQKLWQAALAPDAPLEDRYRMRMAVMAILLANKLEGELGGTVEERSAVALKVASELVP